MSLKAKHAFGALENIDSAISENKIDAFDILFVKDAEGKPYVGWISKDGQKEILDPYSGVATLESEFETKLAGKASAEDVSALENQIATKVGTEEISALEEQIATKVDASYVDEKVETIVDERIETVVNTEVETVVKKEVETKIEEKIKEIEAAYEVVEF